MPQSGRTQQFNNQMLLMKREVEPQACACVSYNKDKRMTPLIYKDLLEQKIWFKRGHFEKHADLEAACVPRQQRCWHARA